MKRPSPTDIEKQRLRARRRFLLQAAGGIACLFASPSGARAIADNEAWRTLDSVLRHLLPSEPDSPGAQEIDALAYLRRVVADPYIDADERRFILRGAGWLEELAESAHKQSFGRLDTTQRERLLRHVATTPQGENWIETLLVYLLEALLSAPAYGGNPNGIGWAWLHHIPGFPLPDADTLYWRLPQ